VSKGRHFWPVTGDTYSLATPVDPMMMMLKSSSTILLIQKVLQKC